MSGILDQILQAQPVPLASVEHYIALQLAKRLGDEISIARYLHYGSQFTVDHLLRVFQAVRQEADPVRAFHSSLTSSPEP